MLIDVIYIGRNNVSGAGDCGHAIACIKSGGVWADASGHLQKMTIVIEEPGLQYNKTTQTYSRKIWTNDYTKHNEVTSLGDRYIYLPVVMAHEFGHAAGLWHSPGASDVMTSRIASKTQNIHNNDKKAMKVQALYDNHTSHK